MFHVHTISAALIPASVRECPNSGWWGGAPVLSQFQGLRDDFLGSRRPYHDARSATAIPDGKDC